MDYDKLIEALRTIQDACQEGSCEVCPMGTSSGNCLVIESGPCNWRITKPEAIVRVIQE